MERRGCHIQYEMLNQPVRNNGEELTMSTKPFEVSKKYESNLGNNLYKLWNRLCSGSYFPMPVKRVGIPTLEDRVAQMVVKQQLEAKLESIGFVRLPT